MYGQKKKRFGKWLLFVPLCLLIGSLASNIFFDAYFWGDGPDTSDIFGPNATTCATAVALHSSPKFKEYNPNYLGNSFLDQGLCITRGVRKVVFSLWPIFLISFFTGTVFYTMGSRELALVKEHQRDTNTSNV